MDKKLVDILIRNHTFNTIYVQRYIWDHIPDYYPGLIGVQYYALIILNCVGECKVSELAQMIIKEESAATKLLNKLEKAGLVQRKAGKNDKRVTFVSLTPECTQNIEKLHAEGARAMAESVDGLSEDDYIELAKHILAMNKIFEKVDKIGPLHYMKVKGFGLNGVEEAERAIIEAEKA